MTDQPRDFNAEIAALARLRDIAALDNLKLVQAVLARPALVQVIGDLTAALSGLPDDGTLSSTRNQARNVAITAVNVREHFDREVVRVQAIVDAQAPAS